MTGTDVEVWDEDYTGLEDFEPSRMVIPRMQIDHKNGAFVDTLTKQSYPGKIEAVILGMVLQRILWHVKPGDDKELPLCKSPDAKHGYPTPMELLAKGKLFPWAGQVNGKGEAADSGFREEDYPPNEDGLVELPCANCALKEWGAHPTANKPYCGEVYVLPLLFAPDDSDPENLMPALLSVKSTGLKPANQYITSFKSRKTPMFTTWTEIRLDQRTFSGNPFCVPLYKQLRPTERGDWGFYGQNYQAIRSTITRPPTPTSIGDDEDSAVSVEEPKRTATKAPATPQPAPKRDPEPDPVTSTPPVAEAAGDDDDLPF